MWVEANLASDLRGEKSREPSVVSEGSEIRAPQPGRPRLAPILVTTLLRGAHTCKHAVLGGSPTPL